MGGASQLLIQGELLADVVDGIHNFLAGTLEVTGGHADALGDAAKNPSGGNLAGLGVGLGAGAAMSGVFGEAISSAENKPKVKAVKTTTCPKCNSEVKANLKFCPECGAKFAPSKKVCGSCGAEVKSSAKFCPECGEKL